MKNFGLPEDPYMYLPSEDKDWQFVLQAHVRSRSVHGDLRLQITKDLLVGWTLDWIKGIKRPAKSLEDATKIIHKRLPQAFRDLLDPHVKTVCQKKAVEPCFVRGSLIWTADGLRPIEKIRPGDLVLSASGKWTKVLENIKLPRRGPLRQFKVQGGLPYISTMSHPLLTKEGFVPVSDLHRGDLVLFPKAHSADILRTCKFLEHVRFDENQSYFMFKVESIRDLGQEETSGYRWIYNLKTEDHTFCICNVATHNSPWLHVNAWFPKGTVGATRFHPGQMIIVDHGIVEFLCQKPSFHEYWFHGSTLKNRFTVRQLPNVWHKKAIDTGETDLTGRGFAVWMASFTKDLLPYAISMRAVQHAWYPPEGFSCLPRHVRKQIPERFRYWHLKGKKAHAVRDDLVVRIHKHFISIT